MHIALFLHLTQRLRITDNVYNSESASFVRNCSVFIVLSGIILHPWHSPWALPLLKRHPKYQGSLPLGWVCTNVSILPFPRCNEKLADNLRIFLIPRFLTPPQSAWFRLEVQGNTGWAFTEQMSDEQSGLRRLRRSTEN